MEREAKTFRDLRAWQTAMDLVEAAYMYAQTLPAVERFGLADQLRRAAVSVPANICEGYGRGYTKDCQRFFSIALGSLRETETLLLIGQRLSLGTAPTLEAAIVACRHAGVSLLALRRTIICER